MFLVFVEDAEQLMVYGSWGKFVVEFFEIGSVLFEESVVNIDVVSQRVLVVWW